jgi:uncharacterized membrane protein
MLCFIALMCLVHWAFLAAANAVLRLPLSALLLGSNACIGGPATAVTYADSKGWAALQQPAMLAGSLGYAVGTAGGLLVAWVLQVPLAL